MQQIAGFTMCAICRNPPACATMVTAKTARSSMDCHVRIAVIAIGHRAASFAHQNGRKAAPIDKNTDLLTPAQYLAHAAK